MYLHLLMLFLFEGSGFMKWNNSEYCNCPISNVCPKLELSASTVFLLYGRPHLFYSSPSVPNTVLSLHPPLQSLFLHIRGALCSGMRLDEWGGWVWQIGSKMWDKEIAFHIELGIRDNMNSPCIPLIARTSCRDRWKSGGNWKALSVSLITPQVMEPVSL